MVGKKKLIKAEGQAPRRSYDSKKLGSIGAAGIVTNTTKAFINYNASNSKITEAMNQGDEKNTAGWFYQGGGYKVNGQKDAKPALIGPYNPELMRRKKGISRLAG